MCKFKSFIVTKNDILHDLDDDSHEALIKAHGLKDNTPSPLFVRVEMTPKDGNSFNHVRENWHLRVDQDYRPDWFSEKEAEEACWPKLEATFKARFLLSGNVKELTKGKWFIGDSATIEYVGDSATINSVGDSANIKSVWGSATIKRVGGSATINSVWDSATIAGIYSKTATWKLKDNAIAIDRTGDSVVVYTADKATRLKVQK